MPRRERDVLEAASFGFDDFLATVGGDPQGSASAVGMRVPALAGVRYLFLGARADLDPGDAIVGYRQLATVGFAQTVADGGGPNAAPLVVFEREISAPQWHPPDGFISWHLTTQPMPQAGPQRFGPSDQESFAFEDSSTPALLYETATFPGIPPAPGYLGLSAYSPPAVRGTSLLTLRDVRGTWQRPARMRFVVNRPTAVRFYVAVLQTNPATREAFAVTPSQFTIEGLGREDNFAQAFPDYQYWRVGVDLLIERATRRRKKG